MHVVMKEIMCGAIAYEQKVGDRSRGTWVVDGMNSGVK
jgi:hypothetical protein